MIENPVADAWRAAVAEMGLPFAAPFRFIDNRGKERQCTGLLPHIGSPMGTLMSTKYDPESDTFIESVRGLGYYPVILNSPVYETYNPDKFVGFLRDWGWYGSETSMPAFFLDDDGSGGEPGRSRKPHRACKTAALSAPRMMLARAMIAVPSGP